MTPTKRSPDREPTSEDLRKDERAIGENIPDEMVGLDSADVGDVERHETPRENEKA